MINRIRVFPDRCLIPEHDNIGVIGEFNAEILRFESPETINGEAIENFTMQVVIQTGDERYIDEPENNEFKLDARFTNENNFTLVVQYVQEGEVKWRSLPLNLYIADALPDSKEHRTYLNNISFEINEDGHLIIGHDGNINFRRTGDNLEVNI